MQKDAVPQHVVSKPPLIYCLELWLCPQSYQICAIWISLNLQSSHGVYTTPIDLYL